MTHVDIRARAINPFLKGAGVEIGAGLSPHPLPRGASVRHYDLRNARQLEELFGRPVGLEVQSLDKLASDFPQGCDFLVAHNVLEHVPDPISELAGWHAFVRKGGVVALSLPDYRRCLDSRRKPAPIEHLVLDYALRRGATAFESKEHIPPFILGWLEDMWVRDFTGRKLADHVLSELARDVGHDLHWHAYTPQTVEAVVICACLLAGRPGRILARAHPDDAVNPTPCDIILVYQLDTAEMDADPKVTADVAQTLEALRSAWERVDLLRSGLR